MVWWRRVFRRFRRVVGRVMRRVARRVIVIGWWRDGVDGGRGTRPDEQDGARRVINDKPGVRPQGMRSQPGTIAVAAQHQEIRFGRRVHDLAFHPTAPGVKGRGPIQPCRRRGEQPALVLRRRLVDPRRYRAVPPEQTGERAVHHLFHVPGYHVRQHDLCLRSQLAGGIDGRLPSDVRDPHDNDHDPPPIAPRRAWPTDADRAR
jgi:hypothetical protein